MFVCVWEQLILAWFRVVTTKASQFYSIYFLIQLKLRAQIQIFPAASNIIIKIHQIRRQRQRLRWQAAAAAAAEATAEMPFHFCFVHFVRGARTIVKFVFTSYPFTWANSNTTAKHRQPHTHTHSLTFTANDNGRVRFTLPFAIFERNSLCALSGSQCVKFVLTTFASSGGEKKTKTFHVDHPQWITQEELKM